MRSIGLLSRLCPKSAPSACFIRERLFYRAPRRNFPAKPSLHRRLSPGCYVRAKSGKSRNLQCSRRCLRGCAADSRVLHRTGPCPSRVLKVFGAKSRVGEFHVHGGGLWKCLQIKNSIFGPKIEKHPKSRYTDLTAWNHCKPTWGRPQPLQGWF